MHAQQLHAYTSKLGVNLLVHTHVWAKAIGDMFRAPMSVNIRLIAAQLPAASLGVCPPALIAPRGLLEFW